MWPRWSYFLRADTMHGLYTYQEDNPGRRPEQFHELSHGEGLGDWGIRSSRWEELHLVGAWRRFLTEPDSYFHHLLTD